MRFNITKTAAACLLNLIALHCCTPNICLNSYYKLNKLFESSQSNLKRHFFCQQCFSLIGSDNICQGCNSNVNNNKGYFVTSSIISQVKNLFSRPGFIDKLNYKFTIPRVDNCFRDIYDGKIYKELSQEGSFLSNINNISFTWFTDGVKIFKSSKFSIWPIYLVINELPFSERFKLKNLILAGIWFGDLKSKPNLFMKEMYHEMLKMYNGI